MKIPFIKKIWKKSKKILKKAKKPFSVFWKFYTLKICYPNLYKKYAKAPVDPRKVVFMEVRLDQITNCYMTE